MAATTVLNEPLLAPSLASAREGMLIPRAYDLAAGTVLYRFVDVTRRANPLDAADGAWWFEYEAFQQIKHFGLRHGYGLDYSARLHAAILYEWSEVTGVVRARVVQPLRAWKGRGKQVVGTGRDARDLGTMTPMQSVHEVYQLYIPGLGGGGSIFASAFEYLGYFPA